MLKIKYVTQKFKFHGDEMKVELPSYKNQDREVIIKLVSDIWNMATTYKSFDLRMELLFDWSQRCLVEAARMD